MLHKRCALARKCCAMLHEILQRGYPGAPEAYRRRRKMFSRPPVPLMEARRGRDAPQATHFQRRARVFSAPTTHIDPSPGRGQGEGSYRRGGLLFPGLTDRAGEARNSSFIGVERSVGQARFSARRRCVSGCRERAAASTVRIPDTRERVLARRERVPELRDEADA
jgi:hypothetical protein